MRKKSNIPRLCYINGCWAYFTTQSLSKQWGDDWSDKPYEHNAGEPYTPTIFWEKTGPRKDPRDWYSDGTPKWEIIKVAWEGDFDRPCDWNSNSPYSVEEINKRVVPWLRTSKWREGDRIVIMAGTPLEEFKALIRAGGGKVYREVEG